jgi:hypothetical protein
LSPTLPQFRSTMFVPDKYVPTDLLFASKAGA